MENSGNNYLDQEDEKYIDDRNLSSSLTSDNLEDIPIEIEAKNTDAQDISAKKLQNNPNIEVIESMNAYTHNDSDYDSNDFETQQLRSSVGQNYNQSGVETPKQTPSLNGSDWMKDINQSDELSKNISYQDNDFNASFDQQKRKESMVQKIYAEKSRFSSVSVSKPVSKRCFCFSSASSRKKTKCASKKEEFDNRLFNSNINASMIESEKGAENVSAENSLELSEDLINTKPYVIDSDIEISQKMPEISLAEDGLLPLHRGDGDDFERSESLRDQVESFEESPFLEQTNGEDLEVADEKNDIEQSVSLSLQIDEKACEVEG